jgi:integrase/recombinase XerC
MTHEHESVSTPIPHPHGDLIDAYLAHLARIRRSPRTVRTYATPLYAAHAALPAGLPQAVHDELESWLAHPQWSVATQSLYTAAIKGFYRWATKYGHLDYDPSEKLIRPDPDGDLPDPATDQQVAAILTRVSEPVRLWSILASRAGLRACEIGRLRREHVTEQAVLVHGKGRKQRLVPTHPAVWRAVADLPDGWILPWRAGDERRDGDELRSRRVFGRAWRTYHKLGVPVGIHRLRAWCATVLLQAGHDLAVVQDWMGHANPATTRRYASPSAAQMRAAMLSLPDVPG